MKKIFIAILFLVSAIIISMLIGPAGIDKNLILHFRVPRIIAACITGASLALSGTLFQGVLKNPLSDPYILGTSSGAAIAAVICFMSGIDRGNLLFYIAVFMGSFGGTFLSYCIAKLAGEMSDVSLILSGVAVSAFLTACMMIFISVDRRGILPLASFVMGSFYSPSLTELIVCVFIFLTAFLMSVFRYRALDVMCLGQEKAYHLGVDPARERFYFFTIACLATSSAVSLGGTIGFVGLMTPHIARYVFGVSARILLPAASVLGAFILLSADSIGRTMFSPSEIPAGVIMALSGAPFFLWLLLKNKSKGFKGIAGKSTEVIVNQNDDSSVKTACGIMLDVNKINFSFVPSSRKSAGNKPLLNNVSFKVLSGDFVGILGPNGAGKSTLIKLITGFYKNNFDIKIDGQNVSSMASSQLAKICAFVPSEITSPYDYSVRDTVLLGRLAQCGFWRDYTDKDIFYAEQSMKQTAILDLAERSVNSLSSGERQLVYIAQAIAQNVKLMIFDEPTSHLDLKYKSLVIERISDIVRKNQCAVLAVLHEPSLAKYCDKLLLLGNDKYTFGEREKLLTPGNLSQLYGLSADSASLFM